MRLVILLYKNSFSPRNPLASSSESILTLKSKKLMFSPPFYLQISEMQLKSGQTAACCFKLPSVTGPGCRTETLGSSSSNIRKICAANKLNADPWVSEKHVPKESPRSSLAAFNTPTTSLRAINLRGRGWSNTLEFDIPTHFYPHCSELCFSKDSCTDP